MSNSIDLLAKGADGLISFLSPAGVGED